MRGRGDSGRDTTVPARGAFPERTLRQDELRAEGAAAEDDDLFGDLYLDFEDTPVRAPADGTRHPRPTYEPEYDPIEADDPERAVEPGADADEFDPEPEPRSQPVSESEPESEPESERDSDPPPGSRSRWDEAPRPAETFATEPDPDSDPDPHDEPRPPTDASATHAVTPGPLPAAEPAGAPAPAAPSVPAPPTIVTGSADATMPAAHAVPPPPAVPPMPTTPPPLPRGTIPAVEPVEPVEPVEDGQTDADEFDVPTTSRSDSLRRADTGDDSEEDPVGPPLGVQASAWSTSSHPGRRRAARRERRGLGPELTARDNDDRYAATGEVFIVADGLGGHPAGWYAADVAVRTLVAELAAADLSAGWSERLGSAIALADLAVRRHGVAQYEGMRTTVVAAVLQHGRLHLAGCGDSVCWLVRGGRAFRLTEQGNAAEFGRPWLLTSTPLGGSQAPEPELQRLELHPGDRVVLATDGVGHLPDETVADLVHGDPFHAATTLTRTAVESGDDDATAVVVECDALPVPEGHRSAADPREGPEDAPAGPGALRSDGGAVW